MVDDADRPQDEQLENEPEIADDSPEAGIEALRQQIAEATRRAELAEAARRAETQAREEAETRARQMAEEASTTRRSAYDAQYDSVINALAAAQGELANAKAAYRTAMAEGDFEKAADLAADIGLVAARVRDFESGKTVLEQRRQAGEHQQQQQPQVDPKEAYIRSRSPRTAAWLRRNDRFFTDGNFQRMVTGADQLARGRGIEPESDEYFRFIEEQVGLRQPEPTREVTATPTAPISSAGNTTPPRMPAAPAAGSTAAAARGTPGRGETIRLTAEERELCRTMEISEAAYARQKMAAMARGEIGSR